MRDRFGTRTGLRRALLTVGLFLAGSGWGCASAKHPGDPIEPWNRGVFAVNEALDIYAIEPVARGYHFVVPDFVETGLSNFFDNLEFPQIFANDLLQGKPAAAAFDVLRFLYNTSLGLGGFIDIASMVEIPKNDEDFGQTLGVWGVPPGPYLVIPLLGPSNIRDGAGRIVDTYTTVYPWFVPFYVSLGANGLSLLNLRAQYLEEIAESRRDAFDYYVFVRNLYEQNRAAKVADQKDTPQLEEEDLYYIDDDLEEDLDSLEGDEKADDPDYD